MKLYSVSAGAPSSAVRQALKCLNIPYELIDVNYGRGDHLTEEYAKKNPKKEIPIIDDDGFILGESNAILQYICDKFKPDSNLYPREPQARAIINHRLCFNLATYYKYICEYSMDPIFYDYERTPLGLKKMHVALDNFETYLKTSGTKYAAADHLTIADFPLITSTMCLEAIDFDFSSYKMISNWYATYKREYPELWGEAAGDLKDMISYAKNPPDLSHLTNAIHPSRKSAK
ncbi:glutathione S-transferase 1-like [Arctopsyche grandis]|uniref:glutathione S-transferase 1-like n=1 Tax=Arctopsyche grandis TaxID=121162 RepID=UPI00406D7287